MAVPLAAHPSPASAAQARPGAQLQLLLSLKTDGEALRRLALAVSTRGSSSYGHYQTIASLSKRYGAAPATRTRVMAYLRAHGARHISIDATGEFAYAAISVRDAERAFATRLITIHAADGQRYLEPVPAVRGASFGEPLPRALRGVITGVVGLDTKPTFTSPDQTGRPDGPGGLAVSAPPSSAHHRSGTPRGCRAGTGTGGFTPNQYLTAYGFDALHAQGDEGQGERVAVVEISGFHHSDITTFASCFGLRVPPLVTHLVGLRRPPAAGGEATLDIEEVDAGAPGLAGIGVYEGGATTAEGIRTLLAPLQQKGIKPQVVSTSVGLCEQDTRANIVGAGITAAENALATAAAAGITYVAAAGDDGSADCTEDPGAIPTPSLAVDYPGSSPYVTSVGGTNLLLGASNQILQQPVWNDAGDGGEPSGAGGGGDSRLFARPAFQTGVVRGGQREVPDVAMLADVAPGYAIYCSVHSADCVNSSVPSAWQTAGGTSAAAPLLAGGIALVDQALRVAGHPPVGMLNPLLYQLGRSAMTAYVFSDVTLGSIDEGPFIPRYRSPLGCCSATVGYDNASGWGSINIAALAAQTLTPAP